MFNRSTKLTAVLVAAASIVSCVPAMASTKLETKDGTVEKAVAFKDGKYLYQGYRTDDDEKALYFNAGDKDKKLDNATELAGKFDKSSVAAKDGSDNYVVDVAKGTISDDDTLDDLESTAKTKLTNKLKKTDRYGSNFTESSFNSFDKVADNQFGDVWYAYTATSAFGYTNASGSYIDCSFDLNAYVYYNATTGTYDKDSSKYDASAGKTYKIEDRDDTVVVVSKDNSSTGADIKASVKDVQFVKYLGQDDKNIYSLIKIAFNNAMDVKDNGTGEYDAMNDEARYFVQKVSKAQGDQKDDAYKPKTTECYEVSKNFDNGDVKDAVDLLTRTDSQIRVVDGAFYVIYKDDDKVKVNKVVLRTSEKINVHGSKSATDKISAHVAKKDGDTDTKADDFCFDVNGAVWAIYNGEIKRSVKKAGFETVYTCDRSLDKIDVYDDNNLIAWDENGDVYTTVQEGSKKDATDVTTTTTTPAVKTGWDKDAATGTWYLYDAAGTKLTGWQAVGGKWYYMDLTTGAMKTGWVQSPASGKWFYMDPVNGDMKTGWQLVGGTWYYMNPSNGDMQTGWVFDGSNWYYMYESGAMASNTTIGGYVLGANGAWIN